MGTILCCGQLDFENKAYTGMDMQNVNSIRKDMKKMTGPKNMLDYLESE